MSSVDEYRVQIAIDELHNSANWFSAASQNVQSRAHYLAGISLDITYSANDWAGAASQSFQNAWGQYDLDLHKALEALDSTAQALNNLAARLEHSLEIKRETEQRANALLLATAGLTLLDMMQLGLDPATDALTAGTAAGAAAAAAQAIDLGALVGEADFAIAATLVGIVTTEVGTLYDLNQGGVDTLSGDGIAYSGTGESSPASGDGISPTEELTIEDGKPSLFLGGETSLWSAEREEEVGELNGAPVSVTSSIEAGNARLGIGMEPDEHGNIDVGIVSELSLLKASDDLRLGSKDLGWTTGVETEVGDVEGTLGWHDNSLGAKVGATLVSDTVSTGVDIDNFNVGVDATIGIKAELGFEIGEHTEIKLPFVSFGFSFGSAK